MAAPTAAQARPPGKRRNGTNPKLPSEVELVSVVDRVEYDGIVVGTKDSEAVVPAETA
jgi:hypothetical protein